MSTLVKTKPLLFFNLLSLVFKLDKGQDSVFWFFKKMYNQQKRKRFPIGRWKSAESECSPITGTPKQFLDLCYWVTRVTQSSLGAILLLTVIKCNRVWCHRPLLVFVKISGEFHRIKMALSFGTVIPEREKEDVQDYKYYKDEDGSYGSQIRFK